MRTSSLLLGGAASVAVATINSTLADLCTKTYAVSKLPVDALQGITIDSSSVTAQAFYNQSVSGSVMYPDFSGFDYCNVTFAYSHNGLGDQILVTYWLPDPAKFENRYLQTGGGGLAINSGTSSVIGGVIYGAASGLTDGGFGSFDNMWDDVFPLANGSANWPAIYNFGYLSLHENAVLGKAFTKYFYGTGNSTKLYNYYQGCSEGGREGWSQVQRFADEVDGAVIGAPAFRYSFQQVQHLYSNVVEQTLDYYPPPCELMAIVNRTIEFCDPLDGLTDGVVSRTDLCKLTFNINSTIGTPYYCQASSAGRTSAGYTPAYPAQSGNVSAQGAAVAAKIIEGLKDSQGRQVYFSYQPAATFVDAQTEYDNSTDSWVLDQSGLGAEWVERYLMLQNASLLPTLEGVTYDTLKGWMIQGLHMYSDSLQTTWPDLGPFHQAGGKVLHYHGESDNSIPTASSVRYHESVRKVMYPGLSYNASNAALNKWYKLYLVPGAAHCDINPYQPNGPWPQTNLQVMIDWVERGIEPTTLNATVLQGQYKGENRQICQWPLRPKWTSNARETANPECVYDQSSIDTWHYDLDAIPIPVY
ncbi:tannase and feruloyl esterase [Teratosphaeria nubilosa]|uniref:Carboxylic ester hydrolase n=1 Tax=Teratosphaeria nubilosa TaxID=161662 RepID=A0A6G1L9C9_9PEZI|nr:tannase and feruloyl esterase [Teratosphaeria nubilosa]